MNKANCIPKALLNAITILFGATSVAELAFGFAIEPIQWTRRVPNLDVRRILVNVTGESEQFIQFEINKPQDEYCSREVASPSSAFDFVGQADHLVDCCFELMGITCPSLDLAVDVDSIFRLETSGRNNHYAGLCRSNDGAILASDRCPERYPIVIRVRNQKYTSMDWHSQVYGEHRGHFRKSLRRVDHKRPQRK